ncbi:DMT family transporter [Chengkuizengella axinellae]|uniref:DMT family transporter n=1 Tax=Chengkuizengella axinellae TaxID=3064388 RepID=A0ABT9IT82_9BACL|nr:DMT family transporter [Chengkuizengella sp. 2205SS18-9]MDP5272566.1 DMT family transporter [Chengkuizengella sp. 2205SS18-9]
MDKKINLLPHIVFALVYFIWGINIASMKIGGLEWDPLVFNGIRFLIVLPILWTITYLSFKSNNIIFSIKKNDLLLVAGLGVLNAVGMEAMLSYALQYSTSANGAVLGRGFMPVVTALFALLLKEIKLTNRILFGLPIAFFGVVLMMLGNNLHFGIDTLRGDVLLLTRAFFGAAYLIGMNHLLKKYPITLIISLEMTAGAMSLLPFVILNVDVVYLQSISVIGWISLIYTSIIATVIAFYLHHFGLRKLGSFKASVYGFLLPITAAVAGFVILQERLSLIQILGAVAVLCSMYLIQKERYKISVENG